MLFRSRKIDFTASGDVKVYCNDEFFGIGCADVNGKLDLKTYLKDD